MGERKPARRPAPKWPAEVTGKGKAPRPRPEGPRLICAADVEPQPVHWLWRPYVPQGMVTLLSGDPGLGKSWLTMAIAAAITRGEALPGSVALPPRRVLVMNSEDSIPHTIVPRLIALGADLSRVHLANRTFPLDREGILLMEDFLKEVSAGVVFIDPLVAWIGSKVDMHRANEVRGVMAALAEVADRSGAAILGVRHLRKSGRGDGGKAIYAGIGSIDFTAAVRSELMVERAKDGTRVLRHIKCNVGPLGPTLAFDYAEYDTVDEQGRPVVGQRFEWIEGWEGELEEPERAPRISRTPRRNRARDFLREFLAGGPRTAVEVFEAAELNGITERTLKKAKTGVARSYRSGDQWLWELVPEGEEPQPAGFLDPKVLEEARERLGADG